MTELRLFGRSGREGIDVPPKVASDVAVGVAADIFDVDGKVVDGGKAAARVLVCNRASAVDESVAPAVPARSHGLGGEAVVIVGLLCPHGVV